MDPKLPIERLIDETRIRGESGMILDKKPEAVTQDDAQQVINAVLAYIEETGISRTKIAKAISCAASTLGQVMAWKYIGQWQGIILDLAKWLEDQRKRDAAPKDTEFCLTKVAEEIMAVADFAIAARTIGLVYGPTTSGIGKTMALEAIVDRKAGAFLVTVEKVNASAPGLLRAIARELRIGGGQSTPYLFARIKEKLVESNRLMMIDQIHNLCGSKDDKPFYVLTEIQEATKAPQLWCGTSDIIAYLDRGQSRGKDTLAQIRSRIGLTRDLLERTTQGGGGEPLFTIDDIRNVFRRCSMRLAPDAARHLALLANLPDSGALRMAKNLVRIAVAAYSQSGATVLTSEMLRQTQRMTCSRRVYQMLETQLESDAAPVRKVG